MILVLLVVLFAPVLILGWMIRTVLMEPKTALFAVALGILVYLIDHH